MAQEKNTENKIKSFIRRKGGYIVKYHGGFFTKSGVPDLLICYKGKFIAIEVKSKHGKLTEAQKIHLKMVEDARRKKPCYQRH